MQSAAGGRKENEKITRAVQSRAQERPANEKITREVQSEAGDRKDNEKITRAVQSEAGGQKENEKITRVVQSRAQEHPVALSVRLLLRFGGRHRRAWGSRWIFGKRAPFFRSFFAIFTVLFSFLLLLCF